jgi:hypothetical protein
MKNKPTLQIILKKEKGGLPIIFFRDLSSADIGNINCFDGAENEVCLPYFLSLKPCKTSEAVKCLAHFKRIYQDFEIQIFKKLTYKIKPNTFK